MKVQTGYLYHIKEEFFIKFKGNIMETRKDYSRPSYLAVRDKEILWFIPLSTRIQKYRKIIDLKKKKYGSCKGILIKKIAGKEQVILIQNSFPTIEKYISSKHTIDGRAIKVPYSIEKEITRDLEYFLSLKARGLNLFFTDIDNIKKEMLKELKATKKQTT